METKICKHCSASFSITDKDLDFYDKVSPSFPCLPNKGEGETRGLQAHNPTALAEPLNKGQYAIEWDNIRYLIPTPTLCPDCRQQRRLSFRNERKLYKRKCDATGKDIISIYTPESLSTVYDQDFWWSDKWDPMSYGHDFDFSRTFFEQFGEFMRMVPVPSLSNLQSEGCDYSNFCQFSKNCYLSSFSIRGENLFYCYRTVSSADCMDCSMGVRDCSNGYELIGCSGCSEIFHSQGCRDSNRIKWSSGCMNCECCIGCVNLHGKKYHIFNEPVTESEFEHAWETMNMEKMAEGKIKLSQDVPFLGERSFHSENNFRCANMTESHNSAFCMMGGYFENSRYCAHGGRTADSYDIYRSLPGLELSLEGSFVTGHRILFSLDIAEGSSDLAYCVNMNACTDCFACSGLRNKQYCIFNKQYTREQYEVLVPKIIEHMKKTNEWGEFFPSSISPFGYNETVANEYCPLSRDVAMQHLYNWSDYEAPFPKVEKIIPASKLPQNIKDIPDDILNWAIECEVTKKPFRIITQELEFYRKHGLPIPRRHPDRRHMDRTGLRNIWRTYDRACDSCGKMMVTVTAPNWPKIVYCEACYDREVIG